MAAEAAYSLQGHLISEAVGGEGRKELAASTVLPCFSCTHSGIPKKPKPNVPTLITTKSHCWRAQLHREQQKSGEKFLSVNSSTKNPLEVMAHKSPQFKPNSESRPSLLCWFPSVVPSFWLTMPSYSPFSPSHSLPHFIPAASQWYISASLPHQLSQSVSRSSSFSLANGSPTPNFFLPAAAVSLCSLSTNVALLFLFLRTSIDISSFSSSSSWPGVRNL